MTPTQRTDIETALDAMAMRIVRDLPPNTRRLRSDFNGRHHGPQQQIPEVV